MADFEDETTGLVKTLLRAQNGVVPLPGGKEHFDIYLAKQIYPVLVPGLEELSREIDRLVNAAEGEIDISIKDRFNPCIFLAEYLMRNNPRHGSKLELTEPFIKYSRVEKIRRFFNRRKQKIYKDCCIQPYQANFTKENFEEYLQSLDAFLDMKGKLVDHFKYEEHFTHLGDHESVQFEDFYDVLSMWAVSPEQTKLDYEDFANEEKVEQTTEQFKKMTDRIV